ncbi:MAG: hypothetical protein K1X64_06210 [Myxococcaceae bacterium]|nr:hypothetical protein [Myxococcaceae bacterium]
MLRLLPCVFLAAALSSCSQKPSLNLAEGCQPLLNGYDCFMPYPSDFFRVADASQATGGKIEVKPSARITTVTGTSADVHGWKTMDGFSPVSTLVFGFHADVSKNGFVTLLDAPEKSLESESNTVIIEASTGKRIAHFVDLDPRATDPLRRALVVHPYVALAEKQRYVVFVHGVTDNAGQKVPAPEGFQRLRDGESAGDSSLEAQKKRYENDIFPALTQAGIARQDLQLAWDFTVGSNDSVTRDLLKVRELTLAWLKTNTPTVTITDVKDTPDDDVWRRIYGKITVPLFLTKPDPGSRLNRDAAGEVVQNGTTEFPLYATVPASVRDQFGPGQVLAYGHGFFGSATDVAHDNTRVMSQHLKAVMVATDWWGMSLADVGKVGDGLTSYPNRVMDFSDRVSQAMANWLVLTSTVDTQLKNLDAFKRPSQMGLPGVSMSAGQSNAGASTFQGPVGYIGCSQGHILGAVMTSLNPDIHRAVLNVGGAGFTHLMMRARPFDTYLVLLGISIKDPLDQQKYLATLQRHFDRFDPALYAPYFSQTVLPGNPKDRRVLMQMGLGDVQVPNLGSLLHARILDVPVLTPAPVAPYGLRTVMGPYDGSALAIYDFGIDVNAVYRDANPQPDGNAVHDTLRNVPAAMSQMEQFFSTGQILSPCTGACDPE